MGGEKTCTATTSSSNKKKKRKCNTGLVEEKPILCHEDIKKEFQEEGTVHETEEDSPTKAHCTQKIRHKRMKLEED